MLLPHPNNISLVSDTKNNGYFVKPYLSIGQHYSFKHRFVHRRRGFAVQENLDVGSDSGYMAPVFPNLLDFFPV